MFRAVTIRIGRVRLIVFFLLVLNARLQLPRAKQTLSQRVGQRPVIRIPMYIPHTHSKQPDVPRELGFHGQRLRIVVGDDLTCLVRMQPRSARARVPLSLETSTADVLRVSRCPFDESSLSDKRSELDLTAIRTVVVAHNDVIRVAVVVVVVSSKVARTRARSGLKRRCGGFRDVAV